MSLKWFIAGMAMLGFVACAELWKGSADDASWQRIPVPEKSDLASVGRNPYFPLEPGYQLILENKDKDHLTVTVLSETKMVDGVETRVVEERETGGGQLVEVSRNYFAVSKRTGDLYYFGEDVDMYKDGKITSHEGSWLAGVNGAIAGVLIPGSPRVGQKFYQEYAPKVAMDRSQIVSTTEQLTTPAGTFEKCVKTADGSALESGTENKCYAPGVGLAMDSEFRLAKYGKVAGSN